MAHIAELGRLAANLARPEQMANPLPQPLSLEQLQQLVSHEGDLERLRCFMQKLRDGRNVTIAAVGGSITAGAATSINRHLGETYHAKLHNWLQQRYERAHLRHATVAIPSVYHEDYMEHCLSMHAPRDADLVLLDTPANLCGRCHDSEGTCRECENAMEAVELMLRYLLELPSRPPVVFVNSFMFWRMDGPNGWNRDAFNKRGSGGSKTRPQMVGRSLASRLREGPIGKVRSRRTGAAASGGRMNASDPLELNGLEFHRQWGHGRHEHMLDELAKYYALSSVSMRDAVYHQAVSSSAPIGSAAAADVSTNAKVTTTSAAMPQRRHAVNGMPVQRLFKDRIHPAGTGNTVLAQGLVHLFKKAALLLEVAPPERCGTLATPLPPPMRAAVVARREEQLNCLNAHAILDLGHKPAAGEGEGERSDGGVTEACAGWRIMAAKSRRGPAAGMHYLSTNTSGSTCHLSLPMLGEVGGADPLEVTDGAGAARVVGIAYLASQRHDMGRARVECVRGSGCTCAPLVLDGRAARATQAHVRLAELELTLTRATSSLRPRCGLRLQALRNETADGGGAAAGSDLPHAPATVSIAALYVNQHATRRFFGEWLMRRALSSLAQGHASDVATFGVEGSVGWGGW